MTNINRIERGARVMTQDGAFGQVYQVIVDPDTKQLTDVVVTPTSGGDTLMIPANMIGSADDNTVTLRTTTADLMSMSASLRYDESEFQPVDPTSVEQPGATSGQAITYADTNTVELGSTDSGSSSPVVGARSSYGATTSGTSSSSTTTQDSSVGSGGITFRAGEGSSGSSSATFGGTDTTSVTDTSAARMDTSYTDTTTEDTSYTSDTMDTSAATGYTAPAPTSSAMGTEGPSGTGQQRKGGDLLKLRVLTFDTGVDLGTPKDLLFDPDQNRLVALLMSSGGWFSSARAIPWNSIQTVGYDSIIIPSRDAEVPVDSDTYLKSIIDRDNVLTGTEVYTEDGRDLGKITDMYFDDDSGEVIGYEVSGGMFQAIAKGKKFMPAPETISIGQQAAFVPNTVGDAMQEQIGGIQGAAQTAASATTGALSTAKDKVSSVTTDQQRSFVLGKTTSRDVTDDGGTVLVPAGKVLDESDVARAEAAGKLNPLFLSAGGGAAGGILDTVKDKASQVTDRVSTATAEQREQQLQNSIGKTAGSDVFADDGTAIAMQGTVVDYGTVERARAYGKENQLLAAISAGQTQETIASAKDSVTGAFAGVKEKIDQFRSDRAERNEEQRIKDALGRPVTRVILDQNDNVILETSQIVTNEAITRARAAGILDVLLDSVYVIDPELSPEALHSGISGQAALPGKFEQQRKPEDPIT